MVKNNHCTLYVRNAIVLIKENMDHNPIQYRTCKELLDKTTTVDRKLLERYFKKEYGYGIKQYYLKQRLDLSKTLMQEGLPMKLVATKCHYSDQSAFSKAFKKRYSISPTDWLKQQSSNPVPQSHPS